MTTPPLIRVRSFLASEKVEVLSHPPYSPDRSPCDFFLFPRLNNNQRTDSPKSLLACKLLMECCVSSMQFYTIHAKKIDDIPMLPILYDKMELYGIYQASGHCTS